MRAHPDLVAAGASAGGDRAIGDGGHGDPARGRQPVVLDQVIGHQRVRCAGLEGGGLMTRLRSVSGPSLAGLNTSGASQLPGATWGA